MNKYRNKQTTIDNVTFDSIKESERYLELKMLLRNGIIKDLKLQPEYVLQGAFTDQAGKKHRPIVYRADFMYWRPNDPEFTIVEDVKGMQTAVYKLKKKMFLYKYREFKFVEI